jgi:Xaa-Pro aminopeptidase
LPAALAQSINWVDVSWDLIRARLVKDSDEIARLRAAISLCDAGQQAVRLAVASGVSEFDILGAARLAMERLAGSPVPLAADVISGPRTGLSGGPPTNRVLERGDLILIDLIPRLRGYWGDSCATLSLGESSTEIQKKQRRIREALQRGTEAIHPGVLAGQLDEIVRTNLTYPHHSGHGLGASYYEEPRIVPGSPVALEAGMVIALEPGLYEGDVGIRLEQIMIVTADGCEVLSQHALEL